MRKYFHPVRQRLTLLLLLILASMSLIAQVIPGLTPAAPVQSVAQAPQEPQAIPFSEIPERLRQAAAILRGANGRAAPLPEVKEIESQLPDLEKGIAALAKWSRARIGKETAGPGSMDGLRLAWDVNRKRLDEWQSLLKARSNALQSDYAALQTESAAWSATNGAAAEQRIPDEISSQLAQTIQAVKESQDAVVARRNEVLKLQSRVSGLRIEIDKVSDELVAEAGRQRGGLLHLDSPPIWKVSPASKPAVSKSVETPQTLQATAAIQYYILSLLTFLALQVAAFVVVAAGLFVLRKRAAVWMQDDDPAVKALGLVVKRPFASALLITVLVGALYHSDAPQVLVNVAWYLMLIPLLRLIPGMLVAEDKPWLWLLAALYIADGALAAFPKDNLWSRIAALLLAAGAAVTLVLRDRRLRSHREPGPWRTLSLVLLRAGIGILILSFGCELFGATTLGRFLQSGVLRVLYGAVLLFALTMGLRGLMKVVLRSSHLRTAVSAAESPEGLMSRFSDGLNYLGLVAFALLLVGSFSLLDPLTRFLTEMLGQRISIGAIQFSLRDAAVFVAVLVSAALLSKTLRFLLSIGVYSRLDLELGRTAAISKLLHYSVLTFGFLLALGAAGIESSKFTVLAGAFGVGLGLGMQNIVGNFVAGLILLFERPVQVGDKISMGATSGQILDIGIRASKIRTWDGADVIMPNGNLISNEFTNWTLSDDHRRGALQVGVACGSDPERVIRVLLETAVEQELILQSPEPSALFAKFGDSSLDFVLYFWTRVEQHLAASSQLHVAVNKRLASEGIQIPYPTRDLYLHQLPDPGGAPETHDPGLGAAAEGR